jgi:hypothetical protein
MELGTELRFTSKPGLTNIRKSKQCRSIKPRKEVKKDYWDFKS